MAAWLNILTISKYAVKVILMITYSVKPGDSLYSIARSFGTTVESIVILNRLTTTSLTVGQTLVIPLYTEVIVTAERANVRRGQGVEYPVLETFVRDARLPVISTAPQWIQVLTHSGATGWIARSVTTLMVYDGSKPIMVIAGFYTLEEGPQLPGSFRSFANNTSQLSEVPIFTFRFNRDDPTVIEKFGDFTDRDIENLVAIGHRSNVMMMPVVHNLLYKQGGQAAGKEVVKALVATQQVRAAAIQSIIRLIERYNFDGVNIDIEDVYLEDSSRLSAFYTELGIAMKSKGYFLSASVPSRVGDQPFNPFSDPFDYRAIGAAVDQFIVMLYNEHGWPGSGPGPVVSSGWMDRVLSYTVTTVPKENILAAISVFGFDFNLTTGQNTYVSHSAAVELAKKYNAEIIFDQPTLTPMFRYTDEQGGKHEVWFENAQSIVAKIKLGWEKGIAGVALWRLGMEDPATWDAIAREIVVRRI